MRALPFPAATLTGRGVGLCTDVIVRALHDAEGIDLQLAVNRDMQAAFAAYPRTWGLTGPDRNIDQRHVCNFATLLPRSGARLRASSFPQDFHPGDIVATALPGSLLHIALVTDRTGPAGAPMIPHNIGGGAREEHRLFAFPDTGHFRLDDAARARLSRPGRS